MLELTEGANQDLIVGPKSNEAIFDLGQDIDCAASFAQLVDGDVEAEPIQVAESSPRQPSWSSTPFAAGDAISSVRRILQEPYYLETAKTYSEPDLVMDILQDVRCLVYKENYV